MSVLFQVARHRLCQSVHHQSNAGAHVTYRQLHRGKANSQAADLFTLGVISLVSSNERLSPRLNRGERRETFLRLEKGRRNLFLYTGILVGKSLKLAARFRRTSVGDIGTSLRLIVLPISMGNGVLRSSPSTIFTLTSSLSSPTRTKFLRMHQDKQFL